ncbi:MAG: chemotaxis protein CheW [Kiloniellales bacterium]|nr:chemotaxis protein CheW [Kiloniellales bacterium]
MDDLLSEFLTETNESLAVLDVELIKLEQTPNDPELLSNIFRLMHTIKGTCGFLGLPRLEAVAHAGENVLGKVRDGELTVSAEIVTLILECLDRIRGILGALEETEAEPAGDDAALIARLDAVFNGTASPSGDAGAAAPAEAPAVEAEEPEPAAEAGPAPESPQDETPEAPAEMAPSLAEAPVAVAPPPGAAEAQEAPKESAVANQSIRVNVELLEDLMTLVSELVLTRNQLLQILRAQRESEFTAPLQRLNHVVSELQESVMKTRMQPIGNAWAKLPRIVRDLAHELDKKIELVMKGAETELDRQVLELIKDPLTHMVRNSADHGLEETRARKRAGKPETGTILLNAYHEGGHIIIEIADDGRGLSTDKIKKKVLEKGLVPEAQLAAMSDQQVQQQIFKPGFSTAEQVTAVSGRGVGMDVVRTNIERIGGTIELTSTEGQGTKFTIKIPLTLAIVSALIVECGGERFAVPQLSVIELVRASNKSDHIIEQINETPVLRLRNRLLPLVNLRQLLGLEPKGDGPAPGEDASNVVSIEERRNQDDAFIIVSQVGAYAFGIIVDRVFDTEEIVVKPVAPILRDIPLYSGNTILGDGSVVMILDPNGIATATGEMSVGEDLAAETERLTELAHEKVAMLVFRAVDASPKAVPLALIARLEEVDLGTVERSGGRTLVQYRGHLMPLVQMRGAEPLPDSGRKPVLVFTDRDRTMGLVVDEIVDIVEDRMEVELSSERAGFIGSALIAGAATDVIDTSHYLTQAFDDWFGSEATEAFGSEGQGRQILLVDDSPFFRNLLSPLLSVAGYQVTAVESADAALALLDAGDGFDAIISDIEMPGMDGFQFAQSLRQDQRFCGIPLVALSSHATPADLARGRQVGFRDYVAKFDRDALLAALQDTLAETRGAA